MADNLDPLTNLPEKSESKSEIQKVFEKGLGKFTSASDSTTTLDTRELLKPQDVSGSISAKSDPFEVQTIFKDELRRDTNWDQLFNKSSERFQEARVARMEQLDAEQTYGEAFNGIGKFVGKTLNRTVLGLAGTVYGLGAALFSWDANQIMDNPIFDASESLDKKMDEAMPIYTNEDEYYDKGFFAKMAYHPGKLLGDEVSDGLSFAASAIGQELLLTAITGASLGTAGGIQAARTAKLAEQGASIWSKLGNTGKVVKAIRGIDKGTDAAKTLAKLKEGSEQIAQIEQYRAALGTGRGLLIGTNYEASMEARGAAEEMRTALIQEYISLNGKPPSGLALEKIEQGVDASKWAVYGTNLALLGASNLIQFPKVFWKGFNGQRKALKEAGEEIMKEAERKALGKSAKEGLLKKSASRLVTVLKTPVTEMLEETSQGITTNSSLDYYSRKYSANENIFAIKGMEAVSRGSEEFFGSAEGSTSMGMGFLIGLLGVPVGGRRMVKGATGRDANFAMAGGFMETIREAKSKRETIQKLSDELAKNPSAFKSIKASYENYVRNMGIQEDMDQAIEANDIFSFKNLEHDQFFSYVRSRAKADMLDMVVADLKAMTEMDLETFNNEFRVEGVTDFTEETKKDMIHKAFRQVKRIEEHSNTVDNLLDSSKINSRAAEAVKETLIHAASTMVNTEIREKELIGKLSEITNLNEAEVIEISNRAKYSKYSKPLLALLKKGRTQELTKEETKERNKLGNRLGLKVGQLNELSSSEKALDYNALKDLEGTLKVEATKEGARIGVEPEAFMEEAGIMLNQWKADNPTQATLKEKEALDLLLDIAKLKNRREEFIDLYNLLVTPKGAAAFEKADTAAQKVLRANLAKEAKKQIDEILENAETEAELEAAREKAEQTSSEAVDAVNKKIDDTANTTRRNVPAYDKNNIIESLQSRYEDNPELFEKEKEELSSLLESHFGARVLPRNKKNRIIPMDTFISEIYEQSISSASGQIMPIIEEYYKNVEAEVLEEIESEEIPSEEVEIVDDKEGSFSLVLGTQYKDTEESNPLKSTGYQYKRKKDGTFTMEEEENPFNIDWDHVNTENLQKGDTIELEVDTEMLNSPYMQRVIKEGRLNEALPVSLVHYDKDGNRHVVGALASYKTSKTAEGTKEANESLKTIREAILQDLGNKTGIVKTDFSTTVRYKETGRVHIDKNINSFEKAHAVSETLKEGEPLLFGIGRKRVDSIVIEVPNSVVTVEAVKGAVAGAVYAIKKNASGSYIPVRVMTRKVNEQELEQVRDLLEEFNAVEVGDNQLDEQIAIKEKINKIVFADIVPAKGKDGMFLVKTFINGKQGYTEALDINSLLDFLKDKRAQVSIKEINTEDYNESIDGDKVKTSLSVGTTMHSVPFVMNAIEGRETPKRRSKNSNKNKKQSDASAAFGQIEGELDPEELKSLAAKDAAEEWAQGTKDKYATKTSSADKAPIRRKKSGKTKKSKKLGKPTIRHKIAVKDGDYKKWDKAKAGAWMKQNLPNVPMYVVEDISNIADSGGREAWGVFKNAATYIANNAGEGTAYHEAFHAVFHLYLNEKQRAALLVEAQAQYGLQTEVELEEALADDFAEYVLSNTPKKGLVAGIKRLFKNLGRFIRQITGKNSSGINDLFKAINEGYYGRNSLGKLRKSIPTFSPVTRWKIPGMSPVEKRDRIDMINTFVLDAIADYAKANPTMTDVEIIKAVSLHELYLGTDEDSAYSQLESLLEDVEQDVAAFPDNAEYKYQEDQLILALNNLAAGEDVDGSLIGGPLLKEAVNSLRKYGIKATLKQSIEEGAVQEGENLEVDEDITESFEAWQVGRASLSTKDTTTYKVKNFLAKLDAVTLNEKGELIEELDTLGYPKRIAFDEAFNTLKSRLKEHTTIDEMVETLESMVKSKPYAEKVIDLIKTDKEFKAAFFSTMATQQVEYLLLQKEDYTGKGGFSTRHNFIDSNRRNPNMTLMSEWNSLFILNNRNNKNKLSPAAKKNVENAQKSIEGALRKIKNEGEISNNHARTIASKLFKAGIAINPAEVKSLFQEKKENGVVIPAEDVFASYFTGENGILNTVFPSILKGNNPFSISTQNETKALRPFLQAAIENRDTLSEQALINVNGKQVFATVAPNHISSLVHKLKGKNYKNVIDFYKQDKFYKRHLWLKELLKSKENRNLFQRKVLDGYKEKGADTGVQYSKMSDFERKAAELNLWSNEGNSEWGYYVSPILADAPQMNLISFKKYTVEESLEHLYQVALQESERIKKVKEEQRTLPDNKLILNYHYSGENKTGKSGISSEQKAAAKGLQFHYFEGLENIAISNKEKVKEVIAKNMAKEIEATTKQLQDLRILSETEGASYFESGVSDYFGYNNPANFVEAYAYNSTLANIQMLQLFSGDTAFYKNDEDLSKRHKQITNPGNILDISEMDSATYKTIYLQDEIAKSKVYNEYKEILKDSVHSKAILAQYEDVNATDAQAYISLKRYRSIRRGMGTWGTKEDAAYADLEAGVATEEQLQLVAQPIKPFMYGKTLNNSTIVPVQNKNSEFLLLPQMVKGNKKLETILDMFKEGVSSVQFESAVKVGAHNIMPLNSVFKDGVDIKKLVDKNFVELNNEDYRIQLAVPEHHVDTTITVGTQIRRLILANLAEKDYEYNIQGKKVRSEDVSKLFNELVSANVIEEYDELAELFKPENREKLASLLEDEILERGLGQKYLDAIELNTEGKFEFPLYFPLSAKRNEALMTSLFKNRVTKQKIKGGSFVQLSDFGFSEELNVVFGERTDKEGKKQEYIKEMEAILPWWSKEYFPTLEDGQVDISKVPEKLRELIGFRIPTEDKYSMPIIKVVGFSPKEAGGVAMLPADITKRAGTDFDIDKLYIMMPEFKVNLKFDALTKYIQQEFPGLTKKQLSLVLETSEVNLEGVNKDIKQAVDEVYTSFQEIEYITPTKKDKKARNNYMLEIMKGILQDPAHAEEIITPGNFIQLQDLKKELNTISGRASSKIKMHMPSSQLELFSRNMNGADLIGIFANHNVSHAMLQHSDVRFSFPMMLGGMTSKNLNRQDTLNSTKKDRTLISNTLAQFLAASVDNAKDPVLTDLNINTFTADVAAALIRTGFDLRTIAMFLNQPIIRRLSSEFLNNGGKEYMYDGIVEELANELMQYGATDRFTEDGKYIYVNMQEDRFISKGLEYHGLTEMVEAGENADANSQLAVLRLFESHRDNAKSLQNLVAATRADSKGFGPTIANAEVFRDKYDEAILDKKLQGVSDLFNSDTYTMLSAFTEEGILKPMEKMKEYFPWLNTPFKAIKNEFKQNKGFDLTEKEIEFINYSLLSYIGSGYEFFQSNQQEMENMLYSFPAEVLKEINNDPYLKNENIFTKNLDVVTEEIEITESDILANINNDVPLPVSLSRLEFNNTSKLSPEQKEEIEEHFEELLENPKYKEFAEKLIKYSFLNSGFVFTPSSFNHLVPISFFSNLTDSKGLKFQDFLKQEIDDRKNDVEAYNDFKLSFLRNNYDRYNFVYTLKDDIDYVDRLHLKRDSNGTPVSLRIDSKSEELKLSNIFTTNKEGKKVFKKVIKIKDGANQSLMLLNTFTSTPTVAYYYPMAKAGKRGYLNETIKLDLKTRKAFTEIAKNYAKNELKILSYKEFLNNIEDDVNISEEEFEYFKKHTDEYTSHMRKTVVKENVIEFNFEGEVIPWRSGSVESLKNVLKSLGLEDSIHMQSIEEAENNLSAEGREKLNKIKKKNNRKIGEKVVPSQKKITTEKVKEILTSNPKEIELVNKGEDRYYEDKDGNRYIGLSSIVNPSEFKDEEGLYTGAIPIGNKSDKVLRDFFAGKDLEYTKDIAKNLTEDAFNQLIETAEEYKNQWKDENGSLDNIEFLTEGLFISSNIQASQKDIDKAITSPKDRKLSYGIATEMDMVVLNHKTGEKHLVDFKTVRVDPNNKYKQTPEGKLGKSWNGKPSKADGYSKQQNASAILTNLNEEIEFDTISLLPIQVWYPEKGQSTDIAKVSIESLALSKEDIEDVFPKEYADQLKSSAPQTSEVKYYEGNITPEPNTVFVFGSNPEGRHGAGAAKIAKNQFGAKYGQGEGLQGNAYALPTKDLRVKENRGLQSISPEKITESIKSLYDVAKQNPNKEFKVAYRNTTQASLNGYTGLEMIEMFNAAGNIPSNIIFSKEWFDTGKLNTQPTQQTTEVETSVVDFKPEDITVSNKLETFEVFIEGNQENGTVGIKGYKIDIKNQPNVNLIATKYYSDAKGTQLPNGWQILELKGGLRLPMTGVPGGAVSSKKDISLELPITLNNVQDTDSNKKILEEIGFDFNVSSSVIKNVTYTPKGKKKQLYTISGNKIFNSKKQEVFKTDSVDRNKIFANLAIKEGRAKKVTFKGTDYIVNNKEQIISSVTGKIMNWGPENGNRRAILSLYNRSEEQVATPKPSTSDASAAFGIPTEELDAEELKKWKNIDNDSNNPFEEC